MSELVESAERLLDLFTAPSFWIALQGIVDHPQQELRVETPYVGVGEAASLDASMLGQSASQPGSLAISERMAHFKHRGDKWRFLNVYDRRIVRFDNTLANRFVAYFVRYAIKRLRPVAAALAIDEKGALYVPEFLRIIRRLNAVWSQLPDSFKYTPLREMPLDHPFLQFDPKYHIILKTYHACENNV